MIPPDIDCLLKGKKLFLIYIQTIMNLALVKTGPWTPL